MSEYNLFKKQSSYEYRLSQAVEEKRVARKAVLDRVQEQRMEQHRQDPTKHSDTERTSHSQFERRENASEP
jgi:hypothetical protein